MATKGSGNGMPPVRRVGRPRSRPAEAGALDPREEILAASATLFAAHGYSATSTRQIADLVGLRQASIFHHFDKKDDILTELLDRTLRPAIAYAEWVEAECTDPASTLYSLSWFDSHNLCSSRNNLAGLQLLPEARDERFSSFWTDRMSLRSGYERQVSRIESLTISGRSPELCCDLVFSLVENVPTWFSHDKGVSSETVASSIADAALRIVGLSGRELRRVSRDAARLIDRYLVTDRLEPHQKGSDAHID